MPKGAAAAGIEIDSRSIRAAKIRPGKGGIPFITALEEISGSFGADDAIIEGLKALRQRMAISFTDIVVTCVGGKQTYAAQLFFRKLPEEELKTALKFEIRKNLSFDTAASTIEYQFLAPPPKKNEPAPVVVTSVASALLQRHLQLFEKAGMPPNIIDVFPLTVANAFRAAGKGDEIKECGEIVLHIGPECSTLVIDGNDPGIPFYNRTIYFSAGELFGAGAKEPPPPQEIERRVSTFTNEISRSLAYYQSTFRASTGSSITVLGSHTLPELLDTIARDTRLPVERLDLVAELDSKKTAPAGKFDIVAALAMRGGV